MEVVKFKDRPELLKIVRAVDPKFRRQSGLVMSTQSVALSGTYWDEGSRRTYFLVNLDTGRSTALPQYAPPQFGGPREDPVQALQPGFAVVEMGVFCGRPATPTIFLHKEV